MLQDGAHFSKKTHYLGQFEPYTTHNPLQAEIAQEA